MVRVGSKLVSLHGRGWAATLEGIGGPKGSVGMHIVE